MTDIKTSEVIWLTLITIADSKKHIELVETRFEFGPEFNEAGIMVQPDTDVKRYAGDPRIYGEEIEANWDDIIKCKQTLRTAR